MSVWANGRPEGKVSKGQKEPKESREAKGAKKAGRADRAADTVLRIAHQKHQQLSSMADSKAQIMLTISVGVIGVSATQVFDPQLQYAAVTLLISSLVAAGFAVLATIPSLPRNDKVDASDPRFNLLLFSDFARLPYDAYETEMKRVLGDRDLANQALIEDLYSLGRVLNGRKYRYLGYCYRTFIAGLVASVVVLVVTLALSWA
ncbi:MAG TPA: Pycsar system effector family protein [Chloroflexota bacterium]|nr:Pycsar system effector family protein [Chloroflexota bacterium]